VALLDLGKLNYSRSGNSGEYQFSGRDIPINRFRDLESLDAFGDSLKSTFGVDESFRNDFKLSLPTQFAIQADYHVIKNYYLNFSSYLAIRGEERKVDETKNATSYILTPRLEKKKWGITLPIIYSTFTGFSTGASFRIGPFYIGSKNLIAALIKGDEIETVNVYAGFKVSRLSEKHNAKKKGKVKEN